MKHKRQWILPPRLPQLRLFSRGTVTSISTPSSSASAATAIDHSGEVAGWDSFNSSAFTPQAFLFSNGAATNMAAPALSPSGAEQPGMNNSPNFFGTGYLTNANFPVSSLMAAGS
jgi:hypothetical protein